jgi:enoyl-[acyl-carrier protein] reductase III
MREWFEGKSALVTGGSRGIGAVISRRLAELGAHVFINYRENDACATETRRAIHSAGGTGDLIKANLLNPNEIREMFRAVAGRGPLDILVHNAALGSFKPASALRANQWDLSMNINARALMICAQEAASLMRGRGGKIVAVSSLGSNRYVPSYGAVGISKAALEATVRYLAVELAVVGIRVNAVSAGLVDTPSVRQHPGWDALSAEAVRKAPAGRLGRPEDVAGVVLFLCSPLAEWVCGQIIVADGGLSLPL